MDDTPLKKTEARERTTQMESQKCIDLEFWYIETGQNGRLGSCILFWTNAKSAARLSTAMNQLQVVDSRPFFSLSFGNNRRLKF